jgi:hypothetical protein
MKQTLHLIYVVTFLLFIFPYHGLTQNTIKYSYSNSGNRTARHVIFFNSAKAASDTSAQNLKSKQNAFEETLGTQKIIIYPNPTQGKLVIDIQGYKTGTGTSLYLYNLTGKALYSKSPADSSNPLDVSGYPQGTYILKVTLGEKVSEWKIVKE